MTLASVPRYDPTRDVSHDGQAVVIGASMAGLVTARVLSDAFDEVVVVDQDPIPDEPEPRKGVPQSHHVHVLLEAGRATMSDLFPGFTEDLVVAGANVIDWNRELTYHMNGGTLATGTDRLQIFVASRPLLEHVVRQRVLDIDNVELRTECQFTEYRDSDDGRAVEGIRVQENGTTKTLDSELVVDATGRTSRTPSWLESKGYARPTKDEVETGVAYSSAYVERPPDDRRTLFNPPSAPRVRGAGAFPVEGDRWQVTIQGVNGERPPTDPEEFESFARSIPGPNLEGILSEREWLADSADYYPFPANLRRRYEELNRFPEGLLVLGDAIASFNPIYGQGMSVASLEALYLHELLAEGSLDRLGLRFFDRIENLVDTAWMMAVGGDFQWPETSGPKPRGTDLFNRYLDRLVAKAHTDGTLSDAFGHVIMMEKPPTSLLRPSLMRRVLSPF